MNNDLQTEAEIWVRDLDLSFINEIYKPIKEKIMEDTMGYTNYWNPKKLTEDQIPETFWNDCIKVLDAVLASGVKLGNACGEIEMTSGSDIANYTLFSDNDHPSICFNGYDNESCETFCLCFDGKWNFCKTRREPYDIAVKGILMLAMKYDLLEDRSENKDPGDADDPAWSFDGDETEEEYIAAHDLLMSLQLI